MKVLELFSGNESFSKVAREEGYETFTIDFEAEYDPDMVCDISKLKVEDLPLEWRNPDIVWASIPCQCFSVASIPSHWEEGRPASDRCIAAVNLARHTVELIKELKPKYYIIENPRAMLRKMDFMQSLPRNTVWYCKYQDDLKPQQKTPKPTDIWNNIFGWKGKSCYYGNRECHGSHPRGSRSGVQGKDKGERALVPKRLCREILMAIEFNERMEDGKL